MTVLEGGGAVSYERGTPVCLGTYGDPRGVGVSSERGTPVLSAPLSSLWCPFRPEMWARLRLESIQEYLLLFFFNLFIDLR